MKATYQLQQRTFEVTLTYESSTGQLLLNGSGVTKQWSADLVHKKLRREGDGFVLDYHNTEEGSLYMQRSEAELLVKVMKDRGLFLEGVSKGNGRALRVLLLVLALFIGIPILIYIFGIDWMARKAANRFPIAQEVEIGKKLYEETLLTYPQVDKERTLLADSFFRALHYTTAFPIDITVVKSAEVNAFAVPGGHIFIMTGLLDRMDSAGQLAALISHELSHINERHAVRGLLRNAGAYLLLSSLFGDLDGVGLGLAENLKSLSYSRDMEQEADDSGLKQMLSSGCFHPRGMVQLFHILKQAGETAPPAFLSTHPDTDERLERAEQHLKTITWKQQDPSMSVALFNRIQSFK